MTSDRHDPQKKSAGLNRSAWPPSIIITIDGPAGAGKTTVSKALAERLGYKYVDTGALYRAVAWAAAQQGIAADDDRSLERLCAGLDLLFEQREQGLRILANERDITDLIRTPEITMLASAISARPVVRQYLLDVQRRLGRQKKAVFEGRDMGTVVFPDAEVKFYLDAVLKKRAHRRYLEIKSSSAQTVEDVEKDMRQRDENDSSRSVAPLRPAEDAIKIDTSDMSIVDVVEHMVARIKQRTTPQGD